MSGSKSESESSQQASSQQSVWGPQAGYLEDLYAGASGQVGQSQGLVNQMTPQMLQSWQNIMNPGGNNPALQSYQNQVQNNFENNIMPAINSGAQQAGGFGGGRQGVAQGVAAGLANQQVADMAGNLYNQDQNRVLQGINQAGSISGFNMSPYQQLGGIIGGPTVLGSSQSSGSSSSKSKSGGVG